MKEKFGEWNSVKDCLPTTLMPTVLVYGEATQYGDEFYSVGHFRLTLYGHEFLGGFNSYNVTHWTVLPKGPLDE